MVIKKITIKNFRSLENISIDTAKLNVIVGLNDIGKSNLLKSLNLFFNNETDPNIPLDFDHDYCRYTPEKKKKAKEILIELILQPPIHYKGSEPVKWTKTWRKEGLKEETKLLENGSPFPKRSKIDFWISSVKYKYVPAVKAESYFQHLLGDLHDTLATTIDDTLKRAGIDFIGKIRENTETITINLNKKLGLKSDIQLPSNLKELFKTLDFQTVKGNFDISLKQRGDGIKTRHIPIILYFLAQQENINRKRGSQKINTIWGYEEPENNLELSKSFELASEFLDYSSDVQIFLTTHSPAFYSLGINNNTEIKTFIAKNSETNESTTYILETSGNPRSIDSEMGVLQIITPYIKEEIQKREALENKIKDLQNVDESTLCVEGGTDFKILSKYLDKKPLKKKIKIEYSQTDGGAVFVHDTLVAWAHSRKRYPCVGIFDKDEAGNDYRRKVQNNDKVQGAMHRKLVGIVQLIPTKYIKKIYESGIIIPIGIEEMFSPGIWNYAKSKNWLEPRDFKSLDIRFNISPDKSFVEYLNEKGLDENDKLFILNKFKDSSKSPFAEYVCTAADDDFNGVFEGFDKIHSEIDSRL